jgi:disulfide oxidoreductase YuzD
LYIIGIGIPTSKVYRILEFQQEQWLKPYLEKRKYAKNDFEKDFYKLMNNAVFGKTMEKLRNHVVIKLVYIKK